MQLVLRLGKQLRWLVWLFCTGILAQPSLNAANNTPHLLTLKEAIFLALRNNPDVESFELQRVVDKFALEVAKNAFAPQYNLTGSTQYQKGQKPAFNLTPGISVLTPIGTSVGVNYSNDLMGDAGGANLNITQPLLRGFGPNVTKIPLWNAEDVAEIAKINYDNNISLIVVAVIQSYYALVSDFHNLEVQRETLKQSLSILKQFELKVKLGKMAPSDVIQQRVSYSATQLVLKEQELNLTQDYQTLLQLLGLDPDAKLKLDLKLNGAADSKVPALKQSIELGLKNNAAYQIALKNLKIMERAVSLAKDQQWWQLNLLLNKSIGDTANSPTNTNPQVGLSLNAPINNLNQEQLLVNAKIAYDQARLALEKQKRALVSEITAEVSNVGNLKEQIKIAEEGVELQTKALEDTRLKQSYGKASVFDLTQQENLLLGQQINLINNRLSLLNAVVNLQQVLGVVLKERGIKVRG